MAEPDGICVSRVVRDQVPDKIDYTFQDLGEQQVKNIARPGAGLCICAPKPSLESERQACCPLSSSPPITPPRLSIVVLPSANLSNAPEQQYFAGGITEDVTTDLSRLAGVLVISCNTAFT